MNRIETKSEWINDHLWYVDPKDIVSELTTLIEKQRNDIEGLRKKQPLSDEYLGNIFNHGLQFRGIEERDLIPAIETREVKAFNSGLDQVLSLRSLQ
jgi:hypothetical protein